MELGARSALVDSIRAAEGALFEVVSAAARAAGADDEVVLLHQLGHHHAWRSAQWSQLAPLLSETAETLEPPETLDVTDCVAKFRQQPTAEGWRGTIGTTLADWYSDELLRCEAAREGVGENGPFRRTLDRTVADLEADLTAADSLAE